jgi:ribosome-associated protein
MRYLPARDPSAGVPLQAAVQLAGWAGTGGQAKQLVQSGQVLLNGQVETRRSHLVRLGDILALGGDEVEITADDR